MSGLQSLKRSAKKFVGHPEETVPIIGATDWANRDVLKNPVQKVHLFLL